MQLVSIQCPHCGHAMEYWTRNETIFCPACKEGIPVQPCKEELDVDMVEEEAAEDEVSV